MNLLFDTQLGEQVYFIPYTTDTPKIRKGTANEDYYGKRFIVYGIDLCDDGEYYICRVKDWGEPKSLEQLNWVLQQIWDEKGDKTNGINS